LKKKEDFIDKIFIILIRISISRYDCRGHLSDLTLWDSDLIRKKLLNNEERFLNDEEQRIEEECEQERYLELYRDIEKEALQQGLNKRNY
jgi:hypothetical protein